MDLPVSTKTSLMKPGIVFLFLSTLLLAACTAQIPTPSKAQIVFMAAQTVASNQVVSYSQPSKPVGTGGDRLSTPTIVPSVRIGSRGTQATMNIATQIAIPKQASRSSRIYSISVLDNADLLVTVEFSPVANRTYFAHIGEDSLQCNFLPDNPNRILCGGAVTKFGEIQEFLLYQDGKSQAVFSSDLWVPPIPSIIEGSPMQSPSGTPEPTTIKADNVPIP